LIPINRDINKAEQLEDFWHQEDASSPEASSTLMKFRPSRAFVYASREI